jgi:hypothetical protein
MFRGGRYGHIPQAPKSEHPGLIRTQAPPKEPTEIIVGRVLLRRQVAFVGHGLTPLQRELLVGKFEGFDVDRRLL